MARYEFDGLPLLVIAAAQTHGRGRSGADWVTADRALAASLVFSHDRHDTRPMSLLAGLAAMEVVPHAALKWPNDVVVDSSKVGGILVERNDEHTVIGIGLNLWWATPPHGAGAVFDEDPGLDRHTEIGAVWGAELMDLIHRESWSVEEYRHHCVTLGRRITWDPKGAGRAVDIAGDGGLVVETVTGRTTIYSGEVRHVRG